jgi:hypothetical protein
MRFKDVCSFIQHFQERFYHKTVSLEMCVLESVQLAEMLLILVQL